MKSFTPKTTGVASGALVGGLFAGALFAMAVPTTMQHRGEDIRFGNARDVAYDSGLTIPIETAPQDLSPGTWAAPVDVYATARPADTWVDPMLGMDAQYAQFADAYDEPEAELVAVNARDEASTRLADDAAGASARAAQEAAADVRAAQTAATEPGDTDDTALEPKAASNTTGSSSV